ncbi:MAG: biotin/lipoyl-binding protein [Cyclobacteriaceae bacterium]|nr:biotin/lipoyl-binding protein [Cyclobacteriaceae bacterium]
MRLNWFYVLILISFILMLYISVRFFKSNGEATVGIAVSKDFKINVGRSALVKSITVVPGMQVKTGDLLVELTSPELEIEIAKQTNRLAALRAERLEKGKLANSEIAYIQAQKKIEIETIDAEIQKITAEIALNEALSRDLNPTHASTETPLELKRKSLRQQRENHLQALDIRIKDIKQVTETAQHLLDNQILLLEQEIVISQQELMQLTRIATTNGVVTAVYARVGEQVSAFAPLMEISPVRPTGVVVYITGRKPLPVIGKAVIVKAYNQPGKSVAGKVIGYGSVIELPEILQKSTAVKAFGQEIFVEIPDENGLASGEKVLVR